MKRTANSVARGHRKRTVRENFTPEQLQGIGEVAIAWNEAEHVFDLLVACVLGLDVGLSSHVTTRINGFDGKLALLKLALDKMHLDDTFTKETNEAADALSECKGQRDSVIHARAFDVDLGIGQRIKRRADVEHIYLSTGVLTGLHDRLSMLRDELLYDYIYLITVTQGDRPRRNPAELQPLYNEEVALKCVALAQEHRTKRLSLPPLPPFPVKDQDQKELIRTLMERRKARGFGPYPEDD
jgi:hypothetical protein